MPGVSFKSDLTKEARISLSVGQRTGMKAPPDMRVAFKSRTAQLMRFRGLLLMHAAYISVVVGFLAASEKQDGLWKVGDWTYLKEREGSFIDRSLWWTAVPAFFFSIFGLYMKRCYEDIIDLEPYLGAYKRPTIGRRSVLLDYRRDFPPKAALNAMRNGHRLSSFAIAFSTFFSIIIIPLSSHLLETKLHPDRTSDSALQTGTINLGRLNENADFGRAFEITSAFAVYNSSGNIFSQWMDTKYAFPSFKSRLGTEWAFNTTVEIPEVPGYYAYLENCSFIESDAYDLKAVGGSGNTTTGNTVRLTATQGGCEMEHELQVDGSEFDLYFSTGAAECSQPSGNGENITTSRLLFLLAWPAPGREQKLALATQLAVCSPAFGVDVGTLGVSVLDRTAVTSFAANECLGSNEPGCNGYSAPSATRSDFLAISKAIHKHEPVEAVANTKTNSLGNLILNRYDVTRRDNSAPLTESWPTDPDDLRSNMIESIQSVYKAFFLIAASTMGMESPGWPLDFRNTTVVISIDVERLFAVRWVSCLVLVVLTCSFLLALWGYRVSVDMRRWDVELPSSVIEALGLVCDNPELLTMALDVKEHGLANGDKEAFHKPFENLAAKRWNCREAKFEVEARGTSRSLIVQHLAKI